MGRDEFGPTCGGCDDPDCDARPDHLLAMRRRVVDSVAADVMAHVRRHTDPNHRVELDGALRMHTLEVDSEGWRMVHPTARCLLAADGCAFQNAVDGMDVRGTYGRYALVLTDATPATFGAIPLPDNETRN